MQIIFFRDYNAHRSRIGIRSLRPVQYLTDTAVNSAVTPAAVQYSRIKYCLFLVPPIYEGSASRRNSRKIDKQWEAWMSSMRDLNECMCGEGRGGGDTCNPTICLEGRWVYTEYRSSCGLAWHIEVTIKKTRKKHKVVLVSLVCTSCSKHYCTVGTPTWERCGTSQE